MPYLDPLFHASQPRGRRIPSRKQLCLETPRRLPGLATHLYQFPFAPLFLNRRLPCRLVRSLIGPLVARLLKPERPMAMTTQSHTGPSARFSCSSPEWFLGDRMLSLFF